MLFGGRSLPGPFFLLAFGPRGAGPFPGLFTFFRFTPYNVDVEGLLTCAPPGAGGPGGGGVAPRAGPSDDRLTFFYLMPCRMLAEGLLT